MALSITIIENISLYTGYYTTLTLCSFSSITKKLLDDPVFWKKKIELKQNRPIPSNLRVDSYRSYYKLICQQTEGELRVLSDPIPLYSGIVNHYLVDGDIIWILTGNGNVYSMCKDDIVETWTRSDINDKIVLISKVYDNIHSIVAYSARGTIYELGSYNRYNKTWKSSLPGAIDIKLTHKNNIGIAYVLLNTGEVYSIEENDKMHKKVAENTISLEYDENGVTSVLELDFDSKLYTDTEFEISTPRDIKKEAFDPIPRVERVVNLITSDIAPVEIDGPYYDEEAFWDSYKEYLDELDNE